MALAAQCVVACENVVNLVREPIECYRVVATAHRVESRTNPPTDQGVEHRRNIMRRGALRPLSSPARLRFPSAKEQSDQRPPRPPQRATTSGHAALLLPTKQKTG